MRIGWKAYFMAQAKVAALRSGCNSRPTGCVIVRNKRVLAGGYNGTVSGRPQCTDRGPDYCYRREIGGPEEDKYNVCLHGETVIKLLDGTYKTIKELTETSSDFWVYSCDVSNGKIVPALATNPRITGYRRDLFRVMIDNGAFVICTGEHRFLLRNCKYKMAKDLNVGDSLMPMYFNSVGEYESVSNTIKTYEEGKSRTWKKEYKGRTYSTPTHQLVYRFFRGEWDRKVFLIHHKDHRTSNNVPDNLLRQSRSFHSFYHQLKDPRPREWYRKMADAGRAAYLKRLREDPELQKKKVQVGRSNMMANWANPIFREKVLKVQSANGGMIARRTNSDPKSIKARTRGKALRALNNVLSYCDRMGVELTGLNYEDYRKEVTPASRLGEKGVSIPRMEKILAIFPTFEEAISEAREYNHKVLGVEKYREKEEVPVYDFTVRGFHNFAVYLGDNSCVFVHNCPSIHAEANAIAQAALLGISLNGAEAYCTLQPCFVCLKLLKQVGVVKVYYETPYESKDRARDAVWGDFNSVDMIGERVVLTDAERNAVMETLGQPTSTRRLEVG